VVSSFSARSRWRPRRQQEGCAPPPVPGKVRKQKRDFRAWAGVDVDVDLGQGGNSTHPERPRPTVRHQAGPRYASARCDSPRSRPPQAAVDETGYCSCGPCPARRVGRRRSSGSATGPALGSNWGRAARATSAPKQQRRTRSSQVGGEVATSMGPNVPCAASVTRGVNGATGASRV